MANFLGWGTLIGWCMFVVCMLVLPFTIIWRKRSEKRRLRAELKELLDG